MSMPEPKDWVETTLGEVIEFYDYKRIPLNSRERAKRQGKYPYYGASGIFDYIDDYIFDGRYLLIAEDGENLNSRKTPVAFFANGKFWVNNHAHIVRGLDGIADDYFLMSYIQNMNISGYITGAAQPKLSQQNLKSIKITLPPLPTQRRIADILSAYDDLIENNTRRIRILEGMAQAIYQEWFGKVDKESLPEGWRSGIIRDFCESYNYGYTAKAQKGQDGIKYLRITDIVPDYIDWDDVPSCEIDEDDIDKYLLREGDIVVARTGATTGYAKRLGKKHPKSIFASYLVRFRIQPEISNHLIGLIVESDEYKKFIHSNLGGAAQPMANAQVLTSFPLAIPPKELQKKFDFQVQPLFEQKEILQMKNANLRQTRDLLLPRLVSGEITV